MHLTGAWIATLGVGAAGAVVLATVAALLRREVTRLQKSMMPLRTDRRRGPTRSL